MDMEKERERESEAQRTLRFTSEINSFTVSRRPRSATARNSLVILCIGQGKACSHRRPPRGTCKNTGGPL